jgi:hypothetical protein
LLTNFVLVTSTPIGAPPLGVTAMMPSCLLPDKTLSLTVMFGEETKNDGQPFPFLFAAVCGKRSYTAAWLRARVESADK